MSVPCHIFNQVLASITVYLNIIAVGIWCAWPAVILPKLKAGEIPITVSQEDMSWIASLMDLGAFLSPYPMGSYLMDRLGRVATQRFGAIMSISGSLLVLVATTPYHMYLARFLAGISLGISYTAVPTYVAEIASPEIRGTLTGIAVVFHQSGTACAMTFGPSMTTDTLHWILLSFPLCFLLLSVFIPESPYFYFMQNKDKAALKAFEWFRNKDAGSSFKFETDAVKKRVEQDKFHEKSLRTLFATKGNRRALKIFLATCAILGLGGICCITDYASVTLPTYGLWNPRLTITFFGWSQLISGVLSCLLVDTFGRKPLLLTSAISVGLIEAVISMFYYFQETNKNVLMFSFIPHIGSVLIACLVKFGVDQIFLILRNELFPTNVRSQISALSVAIIGLSYFAMNKIFLSVGSSIGLYIMYAVFSGVNLLGAMFTFFHVIETKGKSLEEIQDLLNR